MSVKGWTQIPINSPRGMWPSLANRRKGSASRASSMQNARIEFGTARSRPGTSAVFGASGKVTALFNWIEPNGTNLVLYQDGPAIKSYNQALTASVTLISGITTTRAPTFAPLDVWTYIAGYNASGNGTFQAEIFDGLNVDKAFRRPPVITAWTAIDGGPGQCTQGQHLLGFVYQNRTGFAGVPVTSISYPVTATSGASVFAITATDNGSPLDTITAPGNTFATGDYVTGTGSTGDTAPNGTFQVTIVTPGSTLTLADLQGNPVPGNGSWISGGSLAGADVITAPGNNLQKGQTVTVSGALGDTAINGTQVVVATPTPGTTFVLSDTDGNLIQSSGAYAGSGIVTNPIQVTLAAGLRQIAISVTLPAQADGGTSFNGNVQATLFLIATRSDNPALWYFIPTDFQTGQIGEQPVPLNAPVTLNFVMSLSDEDIAASLAGDTAQANFLLLTQDANGAGPPLNPLFPLAGPNFVRAYGNRMCYGAGTTLYVSDSGLPQQIAADTNAVRMQNQKAIAYAFQLAGNTSLYLTGDHWTGYVTDNSDTPSTWGEPVQVSDALGALFPNLVCAETGGNWAWMVVEGGPYLFDGAFGVMPLTYLNSGYDELKKPIGWNRVNWKAAYAIQIKDDVKNLKLYIGVPLDGATECNFMFVVDYRMGKTYDSCDISLDLFNPQAFSALGVVKEVATGLTNLWIGPAGGGSVTHFDESTHNDQGSAIDSFWQSGLARNNEIASSMIRAGFMDLWIRGNAPLANGLSTLLLTVASVDSQLVVMPQLQNLMGVPAALVEAPGVQYSAKFDISKISNLTTMVRTFGVDQWWEVSALQLYLKPDLFNR